MKRSRGRPRTNLRALEIAARYLAELTTEEWAMCALVATRIKIERTKQRLLRGMNPS